MMIQGYINLFFNVIITTVILFLPILFVLNKKGEGIIRPLNYLLCFWSFFLVIFVTVILFNLPLNFKTGLYILNLQPLQWLWEGNIMQRIKTEIIPNIMLFIPLGIFMPIAFKRMRNFCKTTLTIFIITFSVEFFQYFIGRSSDIDDLIANLLGGIIGYMIFKICSYLFKNKTWWNKFIGADIKNTNKKSGFAKGILVMIFIVLVTVLARYAILSKYTMPTQRQAENLSNSATKDFLILVNKDNKLPDDYKPNLTTEGAKMNKVVLDSFNEMRGSARKEEIYLFIASAYRTKAEQQQEYNNAASKTLAALPGYSEHETGLAIDFSFSEITTEQQAKMWDWLSKNSYKYGFILRYPKGKEHITGYDYEPWHYRYVGKEHAKTIYEKGLVLEEYLSAL